MYKNLIIYYFSGTGNALTAARWITAQAETRGIKVQMIPVDRLDKPPLKQTAEATITGFLYPTHGFSLPWIMLRFMLNLHSTKATDAFLLNTRGGLKIGRWFTPGLSGMALLLPMLILFLKGFKIKGLQPLDMPSSWISLHPGLNNKTISLIINRCKGIVDSFAGKILEGKRTCRGLLWLPVDLALVPIAVAYSLFGRFILAKTFIASSNCNDCRLCEEKCPVQAVHIINGRPYWSFRCESCMRCMNICPKKSIQAAHGFVIISFIILSFIPYSLWITAVLTSTIFPGRGFLYSIIFDLAGWSFQILFFFIAYRLLCRIIQNRAINDFFTFSSLTRYWRRYMAPRVKASDFIKK